MGFIQDQLSQIRQQAAQQFAPTSGLFTVDPGQAFTGNNGGTDLMGRITRAQWDHYKATFLPSLERAMSEIGSEEVLNKQIARGEDAVNKQYDGAVTEAMNSASSLGASLDPDQVQSLTRRVAFDRDKALGSVRNLTRQAKADRDMQLIAGSASNLLTQ